MSKLRSSVQGLLDVSLEYMLPSRSSTDDSEVVSFLVQYCLCLGVRKDVTVAIDGLQLPKSTWTQLHEGKLTSLSGKTLAA